VYGHARIYIGDDVTFNGKLGIASGRFLAEPALHLGNRVVLGHNTMISVNQEVIIEDDVLMANGCWIADNDGHPRASDLRAAHQPLVARDIRPVRICRGAWLGHSVSVLKGVTVGEGAIVGAHSVIVSDVPPFALVMGNPAEVILRGAGKPALRDQAIQRASVPAQE
jgi:acetyltransferase-like isoleucine patch superfamily enzyme